MHSVKMSKVDPKKSEPVRQVFQGKSPREEASLWSKLTYSYIWPILESSMIQRPCLEQYGECHESKRLGDRVRRIEESIDYFVNEDKSDRYALYKGCFWYDW